MNYKTYGELANAVAACKTQEEANEVFKKAKEDNPEFAEQNIGYLIGYFSDKEQKRLYKFFETCNHPIFGPKFGRGYSPTPEEALAKGIELANKH